jgi:hypothetical protein
VDLTIRDIFPRNPRRTNIHRGDDQGRRNRAVAIRGKSSLAVLVSLDLHRSLTRIVNSQICALEYRYYAAIVGPLEQWRAKGGVDLAAQEQQLETSLPWVDNNCWTKKLELILDRWTSLLLARCHFFERCISCVSDMYDKMFMTVCRFACTSLFRSA